MKPSELRGMSLDELRGELAEQQRGYYNLRFRRSVGEDISVSEMKRIRREIARVKTILAQKERKTEPASETQSLRKA